MKISSQKKQSEKDFDELIKDFLEEHKNIYFADINGMTFIYKPLGRKAYKEIVSNPNLTDLDREDLICMKTILYPLNYNPDDYDAGIPSQLYQKILVDSYLSGTDDMIVLLEACREEVEQLDIQMSCIISEAFPAYDMDDIEEWDMIKFCRMFAKAEWKLKNMRNVELNSDVIDFLKSVDDGSNIEVEEQYIQQQSTPQKEQPMTQTTTYNSGKVKVGNREMTREEYQQYLDFQRAHPEIDWGADAMYTGYESKSASNVPVPLRTRDMF